MTRTLLGIPPVLTQITVDMIQEDEDDQAQRLINEGKDDSSKIESPLV